MSKLKIVNIIALLILFLSPILSCNSSHPVESWQKAIVQVWKTKTAGVPSELMSLGIVTGDGHQVLTLLNYEDYGTDNLIIITQTQHRYNATFQAVDARTGITLLKLDGIKLPAVKLNNSTSLPVYGQEVLIWEWSGSGQSSPSSFTATVSPDQAPRPLFFSAIYLGGTDVPDIPGTVVTDKIGNILGFETTFRERLVPTLGPIGKMPPFASVENVRELLSSGTDESFINSPVLSTIARGGDVNGYFSGILSSPSNYAEMSIALLDLLGKVGKPIDTSDLNLTDGWYGTLDGTLLVIVYPRVVELKNTDGKLVAQAKWVGIQWGRSEGKFNRLIYGNTPYVIEGGFEIDADLTNLQQSIPSVGN